MISQRYIFDISPFIPLADFRRHSAESRPMRVGALQFDVRLAEPEANLETVVGGLREAAQRGIHLLALPEMWPTSFCAAFDDELLERSDRALEAAHAEADALAIALIGSAYGPRGSLEAGHDNERPSNRLSLHHRGQTRLAYDKLHLFSPTAEPLSFRAGQAPPPVARCEWPDETVSISGAICYDLRFPEPFRHAWRAGAELFVLPAQWPVARAAHWRTLAIGRAVESQGAFIAVNRCGRSLIGRRQMLLEFPGNSLIVAADGEVLAEGRGEPELLVAELDLALGRRLRRQIPVARDEQLASYRAW